MKKKIYPGLNYLPEINRGFGYPLKKKTSNTFFCQKQKRYLNFHTLLLLFPIKSLNSKLEFLLLNQKLHFLKLKEKKLVSVHKLWTQSGGKNTNLKLKERGLVSVISQMTKKAWFPSNPFGRKRGLVILIYIQKKNL